MLKHNSYFDGMVQSLEFERNNMRATVGVITPGEYHFNTSMAERITIVSGELQVRVNATQWQPYAMGTAFEVPANTHFEVQAISGSVAYMCEFLGWSTRFI